MTQKVYSQYGSSKNILLLFHYLVAHLGLFLLQSSSTPLPSTICHKMLDPDSFNGWFLSFMLQLKRTQLNLNLWFLLKKCQWPIKHHFKHDGDNKAQYKSYKLDGVHNFKFYLFNSSKYTFYNFKLCLSITILICQNLRFFICKF